MKETMSKTIEAVVEQTAIVKRAATAARAKQLIAHWQNGFESGGLVQRKLRLGFVNDVLGQQRAN
jgi:hypothetical protein